MPTCIYSCSEVWSRNRFRIEFVWIRLNFISILNPRLRNLFLYSLSHFSLISLQLVYIYIYIYCFIFHLVSSSRTDPAPWPIFPNVPAQSHRSLAPVFFYMIHFKRNLFFKENNSKFFSETSFYKIVFDSLFNYFDQVFVQKNSSYHSITFYILHLSLFVLI
jgi:hypothetical protein